MSYYLLFIINFIYPEKTFLLFSFLFCRERKVYNNFFNIFLKNIIIISLSSRH